MLLIDLPGNDPFFNLAVDEYLLKERKEDFLVIGSNSPSVIIGKHQVAHREADTSFINEHNIPVIRRISGGGTVFHDEGNLNFSFILQSSEGKQVDFRKYTAPVISFLDSLGVKAIFEGKNDLKVNGLKISGNAEHVYRHRVLHHGTLLFSSDLRHLNSSLRKDKTDYLTRGVDSNPSAVANIRDFLPGGKDIAFFRKEMLDFFSAKKENSIVVLSPDELKSIAELAGTKYKSWEWNYAYGPEYSFRSVTGDTGAPVSVDLLVRSGMIIECRIKGPGGYDPVAEKITGQRHMPENIKAILEEYNCFPEVNVVNFF